MADIALTTAGRVEVVRMDTPINTVAGEAITAGAPCRLDGTTGKSHNGNGTDSTESNIVGLATRTVAAGEALTLMKQGILDGFVFSQNFGASIYVSDTDARLGDAAGTVPVKVGRIIPAMATTLGTAFDKVLLVEVGLVGATGPQGPGA